MLLLRGYRYVDDTFVIWPRGTEELQKINQHTNIKFTVDTVTHGSLPFLDLLANKKKPDGSRGQAFV
jgi:hypothetical protein